MFLELLQYDRDGALQLRVMSRGHILRQLFYRNIRRSSKTPSLNFSMANEQLGGLNPAAIRETLLAAAAAAAVETLPRFRTSMAVDNKFIIGFDPVTDGDREAERVIRELITSRFPDHAIVGEEMAAKTAESRFEWIIDPIDGTRAFICGVPVWGTLIGLKVDGHAEAGMMAQPFTGETYLGMPGQSLYRRGGEENASVAVHRFALGHAL